MAILLSAACLFTYYGHAVLGTCVVFTHFFYIPIILASRWWKRKGLVVAIFLGAWLIFSHIFVVIRKLLNRSFCCKARDALVGAGASFLQGVRQTQGQPVRLAWPWEDFNNPGGTSVSRGTGQLQQMAHHVTLPQNNNTNR